MHTITRTVVAAVTGKLDLPVADRGRAWDGPAAAGRVLDAATNNDGEINVEQASRAFLLRDGDGSNRGDYKLGFADIIDGELTIVPRAVSTLAGGHGVDAVKGISTDERDRLKSRVCTLYGHVRDAVDDWPECPFDTSSSRTAATTVNEPIPSQPTEAMRPLVVDAAEGTPYEPPDDWFTDPGLPMPTPLVVTRDGRVMGHVADWETCHAGYADVCVRAPHSASGYAYYHYGPVFTASGRVMTGKLTVGGGHADANANLRAAIEHYDDVSTSVAVVRAGEDQHGIWVAGAIRPGATPEQVYDLLSSPLSGDWRTPHDANSLEMIAAHAVNVPGFGIRASATMGPNGQISLVSAGVLTPRPELSLDPGVLERQRRVAALTASVGRDPASRIRAAETAIGLDPASRADRLAASIGLN